MKHYLATAMAFALVAGLAGLSLTPTVAAVIADCDDEFLIPDSEPLISRVLLGNAAETGREDVTASGGDEEITVDLRSNNDKLEFGVFVLDGNNCLVAANEDPALSDCGSSEVLDTTDGDQTESKACTLEAPSSGTLEYYVHVVNQQSDQLSYKIWMSA